jgi:hypothetical protein
MAQNAPQIHYRNEFIAAFEQNQSLLRQSVTNEAVIKGNQATFLVAGSGAAEPTTRGLNGLITARADDLSQPVATLVEWHDLVRKTRFNIFESQGNQREIMQKTSGGVINRKIDQDILTILATATVDTGAAVTASVALVMKAKTILGNSQVPWDSNMFGVISPGFEAYLMQTKEFSSREYINRTPMENADPAWRDQPLQYHWLGVTWMVHPSLPGSVGAGGSGASESCFLYHKSSVGHAYDQLDVKGGYDEEQDYYWTRTSIFMGSVLLQNAGIVVMAHDSSALVGA